MEQREAKSEVGIIAGIVIVIVVLLVGAVYFFNQRLEKQRQMEAAINQSSIGSDDVDAIAADADAMDTSSLGDGVDQL